MHEKRSKLMSVSNGRIFSYRRAQQMPLSLIYMLWDILICLLLNFFYKDSHTIPFDSKKIRKKKKT